MMFHKILLKIDQWVTKCAQHIIDAKQKEIAKTDALFNIYIQQHRESSKPAIKGIRHTWFGASFYLTKSIRAKDKVTSTVAGIASPRYFFRIGARALKIPNVNNDKILRYFFRDYTFYLWLIFGDIVLHCTALMSHNATLSFEIALGLSIVLLIEFIYLIISYVGTVSICKLTHVPYLLFDSTINAVILRGDGPDAIIPYHDVHFNILQIEDSPAYCALEMQMRLPDQPDKKIITDICASQLEAERILNTYFAILDGDEAIFHKKLKRHHPVMSEFNLPLIDSILHFYTVSTHWFSCIFPHAIGFQWVHGHPMGVLKRYITEQAYKKPRALGLS